MEIPKLREVKMRLEFAVVIGIVLLMHSVYWAGSIAKGKEDLELKHLLVAVAVIAPLGTVITSIPTFIVVGLLYWWLYAF